MVAILHHFNAVEGLMMYGPERCPQVMGELQHLLNSKRPELAKPASPLPSYTEKSTDIHWDTALYVLFSVGGTANTGITYGTNTSPLVRYTDSDYARESQHQLHGLHVIWRGTILAMCVTAKRKERREAK